jgi:uncharacterized membrane protein YeaQ/YmgE (transglycosylase-associated protein family)
MRKKTSILPNCRKYDYRNCNNQHVTNHETKIYLRHNKENGLRRAKKRLSYKRCPLTRGRKELEEKGMFILIVMTLVLSLLWGMLAGFIASKIMGEKSGMLKNMIFGVIGSIVGYNLFKLIGFTATGIIGSMIVPVVGACICIWIGRKLF